MRRFITALSLGTLALAAGCPDREVARIDPNQVKGEVKRIPVGGNRNIDILFVIDNSGSMGEEQTSLTQNFDNFMDVLNNIEGGLPNVHIGVISSNTGVGGFNITGCGGDGDDGKLQNTGSGCTGPNGFYISDELGADGITRIKNYNGTLPETFSCIAELGTDGCGFEQHLESMKRALDTAATPQNQGFLRPDAYLAIIFIADEDDCSASNPMMFDPDANASTLTGTLGPLTSFRCTEFGIQCDQGTLTRTAGSYTGCIPRDDSPYEYHPESYVQFIKGLKNDPNLFIVAGIIGNSEPVGVSTDADGEPSLDPSCSSASGEAAPGVRLTYFINQFTNHSFTSICNSDLSDGLTQIAELLKRVIGDPCLEGKIITADLAPSTPGLQLDCSVQAVQYPGTEQEVGKTIPRCKMTGDTTPDLAGSADPCWWVETDTTKCAGTDTNLVLHVERSSDPAPGTYDIIECLSE